MFESYKNFINSTLNNLYHPQHTFTGYFQLVLNSMMMIISFLVIASVIAVLIVLPFVLYKRISNKIGKEEHQIFVENDNDELKCAKYKKLHKKKILYICLFTLLIIIIYVPVILPLILILIDNIGSFGLYILLSILSILLLIILILHSWSF